MHLEGMPQLDAGLVAIIGMFISLVAWATRLEAKNNMNADNIARQDKRQDAHEEKLSELDGRVFEKLSVIERMVATIEGRLSNISK